MTVFPKTQGLIAAAVTPMLPDGSIHYDVIKQQALLLQRNKLFGAFICGTTGEGLSLTLAERENIAETWSAVKPPGFRLIVHVGHDCLSDAKRLARHAEQINADAIAALAPVFFKPDGLDALAAWFSDLADATRLPIYYYHFPHMTGITVLMHEFLQAVRHVPNCAGVKFTHDNLFDFGRCLDINNGAYDILFGRDDMLLSALALGGSGAIGGLYNVAAPLFCDLVSAFNSKNLPEAQNLQKKARDLAALYLEFGASPATIKAMLKIAGFDCGPARLPLRNLPTPEYHRLEQKLGDIGFFHFCTT